MKKYDVYTDCGIVSIEADEVRRFSFDDNPVKIIFITEEKIIAEFYAEHTAGWVEREEE